MARSTYTLPPPAARAQSLLSSGRNIVLRAPIGFAALLAILGFVVVAVFAPYIAPADPLAQDYSALMQAPNAEHFLGTDQVGRDMLSRLIYGARISLVVGIISTGVAITIGVPLGLIAGYFRGAIDEVFMRVMDAIIAFPSIILALAIVALLKPSATNVMLAIGITYTPIFARLIRSQALSLRERDFVLAARAIGAPNGRIMIRHIFPNAASPIIVQGTLGLGRAVIAEASLGFLGVGVQPPTPTWGSMLNQGAPLLAHAPWISIVPGVAIFLLVLAFNLLGDALRDLLDPQLRGSAR